VVSSTIGGTVAVLGDAVYNHGTAAQFANCYGPTWGRFKGRTRPAVGNHEYRTPGAAGYFRYFGVRAGPQGKGWYSASGTSSS
jgi:acid phosphatase type 7